MKTEEKVWKPNPKFGVTIKVGDVVTCRYSGRKITVSRVDKWGMVWEKMEKDHPNYRPEAERYISSGYNEFEPALK